MGFHFDHHKKTRILFQRVESSYYRLAANVKNSYIRTPDEFPTKSV